MAGVAIVAGGNVRYAGQGPNGVKALYPAARGGVRNTPPLGHGATTLLLLLLQRLLLGRFFGGLLGGNGFLHLLLVGGQLFLVGGQLIFRGALCPLDLHQVRRSLLIKLVQLVLLALQGLLELGYLPLLGLHLLALGTGRVHIGLQLVHQLLVVGCHRVHQLHAGGKIRKALRVQQDFQSAHVACGVQGHQPLFKLVDGVLNLRLGSIQLHGQLVDAGIQIVDVLAGGVDLLLHHVNLLLQVFLLGLFFRLVVAKLLQLCLQLVLLCLKPVLLGLDLRHGLGGNAQGDHSCHAQGQQAGKQALAKFAVHKLFLLMGCMKD